MSVELVDSIVQVSHILTGDLFPYQLLSETDVKISDYTFEFVYFSLFCPISFASYILKLSQMQKILGLLCAVDELKCPSLSLVKVFALKSLSDINIAMNI